MIKSTKESPLRVVLLEDDRSTLLPIAAADESPGRRFEWFRTDGVDQAVRSVHESGADAVLLGLPLHGESGLSGFARLYANAPEVPIVVFGPSSEDALLMRAVHQGAADFLFSDQLHPTMVTRTLRHAIERRRAERERTASETRYREIFEQSIDAIVLAGAEGEILDANPAFLRLTASTRAEVERRRMISFCEHPMAGLRIARIIESRGSVQHVPLRIRRQDGEARDCVISVSRTGNGGYLATLHDATQRKESEEALRRTQEQFWLAQKMEAVGRLASGLAHDFNNLLGVIHGSAELLLMDLKAGAPDADDAREILRASDHAASLTRQLLAFGRQQVLQPRTLDLNELVLESASMLERVIREDITLVTRLEPDLAPIDADPSQLNQVLMNLVVNARDAMPMGGELVIETRNAELTREDADGFPYTVVPGPYVVLSVIDTGTGMTVETREHLFEPFFTTKPPGVGTGLGLATVYGIVKQSGGYIWVESDPGVGTTFRVYLPVGAARSAFAGTPVGSAGARPPPARVGGERVLLVEDEPAMRSVIARTLTRAGYRVTEARDGNEALTLAASGDEDFDLLITDVIMPGMSGPAVAERLRAERGDLRVLYISGHPYQEIARHGVLEADILLLEKPFRPGSLLDSVRAALGSAGPR